MATCCLALYSWLGRTPFTCHKTLRARLHLGQPWSLQPSRVPGMESAFDKCVLSRGTLTGRRGRDSAIWPRIKKWMYQKFECCNSSGLYVCWIPRASWILVKAVDVENPCSPRQSSMVRKLPWYGHREHSTGRLQAFSKKQSHTAHRNVSVRLVREATRKILFAIIYCRGQSWTHSETSKKNWASTKAREG